MDIKQIVEKAMRSAKANNRGRWEDKRTQRTIIDALFEEMLESRHISGKLACNVNSIDSLRKLILEESQNVEFAGALKTVANTLLAIFPLNHHLDQDGNDLHECSHDHTDTNGPTVEVLEI